MIANLIFKQFFSIKSDKTELNSELSIFNEFPPSERPASHTHLK